RMVDRGRRGKRPAQALQCRPMLGSRSAAVCSLLALAGCAAHARDVYRPKPPPPETGPIALGELCSMTGEGAAKSVSAHLGLRLAIEELNASGGIAGRTLVVHTFDDQGRAEAAARAIERLEDEDRPAALLALSRSEIVAAASRRAKEAPILALAFDGGAAAGPATK